MAMVIMEPFKNSGGSYMPPAHYLPGVRELCDRHGILLCADEVITGFGRLGEWFASHRFGVEPHLITCAKGLSSAYAAIGALIASERVMEPFRRPGEMYSRGMTFGGHPVQAAVALRNIEIMRRERVIEHVRATEADFRAAEKTFQLLAQVAGRAGRAERPAATACDRALARQPSVRNGSDRSVCRRAGPFEGWIGRAGVATLPEVLTSGPWPLNASRPVVWS